MKTIINRSILILLCACLLLGLAACGITPGPPVTATPAPTEQPPDSPPVPDEAAPVEEAPTAEEGEALPEEPAEPSAEEPSAEETPSGEPAAEEAPAEESVPADLDPLSLPTPAERAAAMGLPEPPDVNIESYEFVLANSHNSICEYRPNYGSFDGIEFDLRACDYAAAFTAALRDAGYSVIARRGYIGYEVQLELNYMPRVWEFGAAEAAKLDFGPGCSDHQTAFAFDAVMAGPGGPDDYGDFSQTEAYQWMLEHCAEYGFILRYPEGKEDWYGTACRYKGHFRYVGVDAATYIMENNLCLEEFMVIMDPHSIFVPGHN